MIGSKNPTEQMERRAELKQECNLGVQKDKDCCYDFLADSRQAKAGECLQVVYRRAQVVVEIQGRSLNIRVCF